MKKVAGLKPYPTVYFELILVGLVQVMGTSLSDAFLLIFANHLDRSEVLARLVVTT